MACALACPPGRNSAGLGVSDADGVHTRWRWQDQRSVRSPGGRGAANVPGNRTPGGSCVPPFQGAGFSGATWKLGTCTGIRISTASVETREFVAETREFRLFQPDWSK